MVPSCAQQPAEAHSIQVTSSGSSRQAQLVPQEPRLLVTSSRKGSKVGAPPAGRSAMWSLTAKADARIPAYRAEDQLQLAAPEAAVDHVYGFSPSAGFGFDAEGRVVYAAGNMLLQDELARSQRYVGFTHSRLNKLWSPQ